MMGTSPPELVAMASAIVILTSIGIVIYAGWADRLGLPRITPFEVMLIWFFAIILAIVVLAYRSTRSAEPFPGRLTQLKAR